MGNFTFLNILILVGIILCGIIVFKLEDLLYSVIAMAVLGTLVAIEFLMLKAPDVALAEGAVGAILTPVIFVITLKKIQDKGESKK